MFEYVFILEELSLDLKKLFICFICVCAGIFVWFSPAPKDMSIEAWHMLAIFTSMILGIILKPISMSIVALTALLMSVLTGLVQEQQALEGFSHPVIWLVVFAFFISEGFSATPLGRRIAYTFIKLFGKRTLGLSYGLSFTDLVLAPAIPSVVARSVGIVFPIVINVSRTFESYPAHSSSKRIGGFLALTAFQTSAITSSMFMTAMAGNLLIADLLQNNGLEISWASWAFAGSVPGLLCLLLTPYIIYKLYPPEIKYTPEAPIEAKNNLEKLGKITRQEKILGMTIILLIGLWVGGRAIGVSSVMAALIGLVILLLTGVIKWESALNKTAAWDFVIWFGVLLLIVKNLNGYGLFDWYTAKTQSYFEGIDWRIAFPLLCLAYFYSHYLFASCTAHISVLFIPFLLFAISLGTPNMLAVLTLIFFSNLFGGLTHYSNNSAPLIFSCGYIDIKDWWRMGFIMSLVYIVIFFVVGSLWWKLLGFY